MPNKDYSYAKEIVDTLGLNEAAYYNVDHLPNFRKYLRELAGKNEVKGKQYATRYEKSDKAGQVLVSRIK